MADFFRFLWSVPTHGFRWVRGTAQASGVEDDYLAENQPEGLGKHELYQPLRMFTGLFRTFADTPPTKEGILRFANKYGHLFELQDAVVVEHEGRKAVASAEALSLWQQQIWDMRLAVELWDAVQARDIAALSRRLTWTKGPGGMGVLYDTHLTGDSGEPRYTEWIAAPNIHPERLELFAPGDLVMPALYRVQRVVNEHLKGQVSPRLLWDEHRSRLGLHIVPQSLIGALWLQFAHAITGRKAYRRCEECGTWFEVSPRVARTNRIYCSNACRTRAYRRRKVQAQQMYAAGKAIGEIAEALGSDEATVAGWVKEEV
ncbi:MAG: hypothetical protein ACOY3F_08080 [Bacillota bacterium]